MKLSEGCIHAVLKIDEKCEEFVSFAPFSVNPWCWSLLIVVMFEGSSSSLRCHGGCYRLAASRSKQSLWSEKRKVCSWCCMTSFRQLHCIDISKHLVLPRRWSVDPSTGHIGRTLLLFTVPDTSLWFWKQSERTSIFQYWKSNPCESEWIVEWFSTGQG